MPAQAQLPDVEYPDSVAKAVFAFPPTPTVTKKYCIWTITKLWGDNENRFGLEDIHTGLTVTPPWNSETKVAILILGKEDVEEELPENTLTKEQFIDQYKQWMNLIRTINTIKQEDKSAF